MRAKRERMKRLLSMLMAIAMIMSLLPTVAFAAETGTKLYLKPNSNWFSGNARFAAYFFGNGEKWVAMTDSDGDGIFEVEAPAGYPSVIFCRMNPGTSTNNWNSKWNQTADLKVPTDGNNMYTVKEGTWDKGDGTWSTYVYVAPTYTIAGTISAAGWSPENGEQMTDENGDHVYEYTYTDVQAGSYLFKVTNGTWNAAWGGDADKDGNYGVTVEEDGSTVTVFFDAVTKAISTEVTAPEEEEPTESEPAPSESEPAPSESEPAPSESEPDPSESEPEASESEPATDTVTVYFRNDWYWPEVYVHYFNASQGTEWPGEKMTFVETISAGDVYTAEIPAWATTIVFNGLENENPDNRQQTPDVTDFADGDAYYIHWAGEDMVSKFTYPSEGGDEPTEVQYVVAGTEGLCGTAWDIANVDNIMALGEDGLYSITFKDILPGTHSFKVTDGTWSNSWGGEGADGNYDITLEEASHVTVIFNAATKEISVKTEATGEEVEMKTYTAIFHFANTLGWSPVNLYVWNTNGATTGSWPGAAMTKKDANGYYTMTVSYDAPANSGVNYIFNNGSAQTKDLALAATAFDAETNTAEIWVELDPTPVKDGENDRYVTKQVSDEPLDVLLAVSPQINGTSVTFEYAGEATSVEVRGTIPGASWDSGIAMEKNEKGLWTVTVEDLEPGVYKYKFFVNGKTWTTDPANGQTDGENSIFTILNPDAEDTNAVTIHVFYNRKDGIYTQENVDGDATGIWNAYVWGDDIKAGRFDFAADANDVNGNGNTDEMVTVITVKGRKSQNVYLKTRMSTDAKDWLREESQVNIPLGNVASGTVNVYINSDGQGGKAGKVTYSVINGSDIVTSNKISSTSYDYDKGKVIIKTLETLNDPSTELQIVNVNDAEDDIAIESVKASGNTYTLTLNKTLGLVELYQYQIFFGGYFYDIAIDAVYASKKFAEEYTYTGDDLGATYTSDSTTFKVWAPTAEGVSVQFYATGSDAESGAEKLETHEMTRGEAGVWSVNVKGDLNGTYYTYIVDVAGKTNEAVDPYARAVGVNGNRGMVIDLDSTDPAGWESDGNPNKLTSYTDAVIYELHVRDFSINDSSGVSDAYQGKYLAFTEEGTTVPGTNISTGIDYLDELGITHLHLLPVYDYASVKEDKLDKPQFNWGYDPQNYNAPEGSYSTNPYDGEVRVNEFKQMVKSLHDHDISVIMDVVYNHVYDADTFCINNIVPGYFSRVNSNTSGCGNDTASEREMVRKYIVESVLYWHQEYHIDGFRFDLVGLLDVETINQIVEEVHDCCPDVIFYGEGWDMDGTNKEPGTQMAKQHNASKTPGFAYFSDSMRNNLGGDNGKSTGFASGAGNGGTIANDWLSHAVTWGSVWTTNPQQVVQYVSCHDNHTLADKLIISNGASSMTDDLIKMNNLAAAYYMTAQGIPFIHAGEELLREKINEAGKREENSYNKSDFVNHIQWYDLKDADYVDTVEYYKGLIAFRAAHPALRYATATEVSDNIQTITTEANLLAYRIDGNGAEDDDILIIFNANKAAKNYALPEGEWTVFVNGEDAGTTSLGTASGNVNVAGISAMILTKEDEGKDEKEPLGPSEAKTIYFTNNQNWSKVYAYAWTNLGTVEPLGEWPGKEMTFDSTNDYGQAVYGVALPASETGIEGVIFNNGGTAQTVDVVPGMDGTGYYPSTANAEGKWEVGSWAHKAPVLGDADTYFLVGYINNADYVGGDYAFNEDGTVTVTFSADSYVYVVNGDNSETYMTDGYQGAVTSATLKDTGKYSLTADKWDKLLIPGGTEVTITMVKNNDNTVTLSYTMNLSGVQDTSGIQDGATLHCWNWSFAEIEENMETIADMGYTAIQTSPVQALKEATNLEENSVGSHWWVYYQPVDFVITTDEGNALGTKEELESMIETAHEHGVKVIVDVVANHLGNKTGNDLADKVPEYLRKDEYWHDINTDITNWNDRFNMTQYCLDGLPDLNTANKDIQNYVLTFLKECIDIGVDGFRFDMAKSIETPDDDATFASDFWPTVINGAEDYAATKGKDVYMYGEVLDNAMISISAYTQYMAVTDNSWGNNLRNAIAAGKATLSGGYHKIGNADNLVIWAESHDTFATEDAGQNSSGVSEADINKTWALVAARADAMGLYLARPESMDQALGVASSTGWDNPEVEAVNEFRNAFVGQSETLGNSGNFSYVVRGTTGIVLINAAGNAAAVKDLQVAMDDGTYVEQITGATFTVEGGKLSGQIGDTGIAVVYGAASEYENVFGETVKHSALYKDKVQIQFHFTVKDAEANISDYGALIWTSEEYIAELEAFTEAKESNVQYISGSVYDVELKKQDGLYRADNEGQKPREMHLEYYAVPYAVIDGKYVYGEADKYSIWQYADDILTKSTNQKSRAAVEAMMRFAKYAQLYLQSQNGSEAYVDVFDTVLSNHNLSTDVVWTTEDQALVPEQIVVEQPEYCEDFVAWAGTSLLLKDQTGLGFVLKGKFAEGIELLYWNAEAYAAASTAPVKGTETGVLEKIVYDSTRDQAMATGISVRLSGVSEYYVRMYNAVTGEYSAVLADSIATNLARMLDKYMDKPDKVVNLHFAQAYLQYIDVVADYLGTNP